MKFYAYARPTPVVACAKVSTMWQSYVVAESEDGSRRRSPIRLNSDYEVSLIEAQSAASILNQWHKITGREPLSFDEWEPMISTTRLEPVV